MRLQVTPAMQNALSVDEMADAFHPTQLNNGAGVHVSNVLDVIEAALLYGADRISKHDFLSAVEALDSWEEEL